MSVATNKVCLNAHKEMKVLTKDFIKAFLLFLIKFKVFLILNLVLGLLIKAVRINIQRVKVKPKLAIIIKKVGKVLFNVIEKKNRHINMDKKKQILNK